MIPGHSHEPTGAGGLGGQQETGLGQQSGLEHGGHGREAVAGAGAGAGAAGLGASALHHHHQGVLPATSLSLCNSALERKLARSPHFAARFSGLPCPTAGQWLLN